MTDIINQQLFEPIIPYIRCMRPVTNYLEIELPQNFTIDDKEVLKYFSSDTVIKYERGKPGLICGSLKDDSLFRYCIAKVYEFAQKL